MTSLSERPAVTARALEFLILTAARSGEVRGMTWGEVDLENKLWTIPASRMKAEAVHEVPLCEAAIVILQNLKEDGLKPNDIVFPAPRGGALSDLASRARSRRGFSSFCLAKMASPKMAALPLISIVGPSPPKSASLCAMRLRRPGWQAMSKSKRLATRSANWFLSISMKSASGG